MPAADFNPLDWTAALISAAAALQTIELLLLRPAFDDKGVWRWPVIRQEFEKYSPTLRRMFDLSLSYRGFIVILWLRLCAAAFFGPAVLMRLSPVTIFLAASYLLGSTLAIAVRWRGTFNGGSDYMTIVILSALTLSAAFPYFSTAALGAVFYIVFHATSSYFIAGAVKLRAPSWRDGSAPEAFAKCASYGAPGWFGRLLENRYAGKAVAWGTIVFELTFPLALYSPALCIWYLAAGILFHLANVYLLGLNRFFWAWTAAYPAIYWCSGLWR